MGRFELDDYMVNEINGRRHRWFHRYDNDEILTLTLHENQEYWSDIERLESFYEYYPKSGVPTFEEEGVTEQALRTYIRNKCDFFADAKMREIDLSLSKWEDQLDLLLKRNADKEHKEKMLLIAFSLFGAILWTIILLFKGSPIFNEPVVWVIFIIIMGWISATILVFLLFLAIDEIGTPIINHFIQRKYKRIIREMSIIDSSLPRINTIRELQRQYRLDWREDNRKQHQESIPSKNQQKCIEVPLASEVINSWPLLEFAKLKGKMQVATYTDTGTGHVFKICLFTDFSGSQCFVAFDKELGELTPSEISQQKNHLLVVQLKSGNYYLRAD